MRDLPIEDLLPKSRTEKKAAMSVVEDLAKAVLALTPGEFQSLETGPGLRRDLEMARSLKSHIARRRQLRFIVKRIAEEGPEELEAAVRRIKAGKGAAAQRFRALENFRDQLLQGEEHALDAVIAALPQCDRTDLRKLQREAQREIAAARPPIAAKALYRYLRQASDSVAL